MSVTWLRCAKTAERIEAYQYSGMVAIAGQGLYGVHCIKWGVKMPQRGGWGKVAKILSIVIYRNIALIRCGLRQITYFLVKLRMQSVLHCSVYVIMLQIYDWLCMSDHATDIKGWMRSKVAKLSELSRIVTKRHKVLARILNGECKHAKARSCFMCHILDNCNDSVLPALRYTTVLCVPCWARSMRLDQTQNKRVAESQNSALVCFTRWLQNYSHFWEKPLRVANFRFWISPGQHTFQLRSYIWNLLAEQSHTDLAEILRL